MSMPKIPDIDPEISLDRCKTIELLLSSIALEEIGLSHILNAEGEKLQAFLKQDPECLDKFIEMNESVNKTLRSIVKSQILLHFKLEDAVTLDNKACSEEKSRPCKIPDSNHVHCCKNQTCQSRACCCSK